MDKDTNKPVGGDISPEKDKWETALNDLSTEDRKNFSLIETSQKSPQDVLVDLLAAVEVKKDECLRKRWKVVIKGRTIILRDVLDKLSVWVKKMMVKHIPRVPTPCGFVFIQDFTLTCLSL